MKTITIPLWVLCELVEIADKSLAGDSNDAEHETLYEIREELAAWANSERDEAREKFLAVHMRDNKGRE
jgi:hypothetical protein